MGPGHRATEGGLGPGHRAALLQAFLCLALIPLKRLKLGAILNPLPERLTLARREQLDYAAFLQIILADGVTRREQRRLKVQLQKPFFCLECPLPSPASETTFPSEEAPQSKQKL